MEKNMANSVMYGIMLTILTKKKVSPDDKNADATAETIATIVRANE